MRLPKFCRWFGVTPRGKARTGRERYRPLLEVLEERVLPSTYHVKNNNDGGSSKCSGKSGINASGPAAGFIGKKG